MWRFILTAIWCSLSLQFCEGHSPLGGLVKSRQSLDELRPSTVDIPLPPPNAQQPYYLIKTTHTSPTHVDTLYAQGLHQNNNRERGNIHPPFTLGNEFSGIVMEIYPSSNVSSLSIKARSPKSDVTKMPSFKKGDKVWGTCLGAFATHIVAPESSLHLLPPNLSLHDAAALGASTAPVSYGALIRVAKLQKGETCLVHAAAGGLGVVAVQIALSVGAKVIGTVSSDAKAAVVERLLKRYAGSGKEMPNGSGVVKYDQPGWEEHVKRLSGGRGVDVVFDTVGLVENSIRCCSFNARVIVIGFVGRGGQMEKVATNRVLLKQIQLLGYRYGETSRHMPAETIELWKGLCDLLDRGEVRPVVYRDFVGLERMQEALKMMTTREVAGKIVIAVDGNEEGMQTQSSEAKARL